MADYQDRRRGRYRVYDEDQDFGREGRSTGMGYGSRDEGYRGQGYGQGYGGRRDETGDYQRGFYGGEYSGGAGGQYRPQRGEDDGRRGRFGGQGYGDSPGYENRGYGSANVYGEDRGYSSGRGYGADRGYGGERGHGGGRGYGENRGYGESRASGEGRGYGEGQGYGYEGGSDRRGYASEERSNYGNREWGGPYYGQPIRGSQSETGYAGRYGAERGRRGEGGRGDDRGFFERAGDEIASWFGDDDAERRRRRDAEAGDSGAQHHRGRGPRGYTRSDDRIREDVSDRLTDDSLVDATDIDVTVSGSEVTLSGTVDNRNAKRRAEDIAEAVSGVRHVQNNLRVRQQGSGGFSGTMGMMEGRGTAGATGGMGMTGGLRDAGGTGSSSSGQSGTATGSTGASGALGTGTGSTGSGLGGTGTGSLGSGLGTGLGAGSASGTTGTTGTSAATTGGAGAGATAASGRSDSY
ncbi:BON domain-containing protein [Arenibaculum pallidiluteum]|uniref:BON domain-containing protein n=1 Tax=Arenibaculum pallidiluteum TaxID=2812559 RepID=UPI001F305157|nr:BON domain-containing protein [Arenibaculum pallidiluteum]